jgi:hypothetical protein
MVPPRAQSTRGPARRRGRYPSDLADAEWAVIEPLVHPRRVIVEAILHVDRTRSAWRRRHPTEGP